MVGGAGGLTKALEAKFKARGAKFVHDSQVSAAISVYDKQPKLKELLARSKPDIVIITLGANEVFVPFPDSLTANVEGIVKRIAPRECYWTGPPTWKPDTGVVRVLREHVAPCKFFDSSDMKLERAGDGIHPTDKGGAAWAEAFWTFFESGAELGEGKLLLPKPAAK
jgi:lysophospholipase L1-like esterase